MSYDLPRSTLFYLKRCSVSKWKKTRVIQRLFFTEPVHKCKS